MKTSPTHSTVPSSEVQLEELRTYLKTSEPFRRSRGRLGSSEWLGTDIITKSESGSESETALSPAKVIKTLNWRCGQARVMLNYLAKLRRDGHMVAYKELLNALNHESFVITGEELPLESRTPGVLLVFEPKRMLDLIRWVQLLYPLAIDHHLGKVTRENELQILKDGLRKARPSLTWLTEKVLSDNPKIREGLDSFYSSVLQNHRSVFLPPSVLWKDEGELQSWLSDKEGSSRVLSSPNWLRIAEGSNIGPNGEEILANWSVARFFPGKTQAEVLGAIRRDLHDQIAVWQFHYPSFIKNFQHGEYSIGLVPESQVGIFQKRCPTFTSNTITNGFGAVILERGRAAEHTMFDRNHLRHAPEEPDFDSVAMELHFAWDH